MEKKKVHMEEYYGNEYRKLDMEQGIEPEKSNEVDYVHELKQGAAKNTMNLINGFISMLFPAVMIGLLLIFIVIGFMTC